LIAVSEKWIPYLFSGTRENGASKVIPAIVAGPVTPDLWNANTVLAVPRVSRAAIAWGVSTRSAVHVGRDPVL
jgi:hypothetical protein